MLSSDYSHKKKEVKITEGGVIRIAIKMIWTIKGAFFTFFQAIGKI